MRGRAPAGSATRNPGSAPPASASSCIRAACSARAPTGDPRQARSLRGGGRWRRARRRACHRRRTRTRAWASRWRSETFAAGGPTRSGRRQGENARDRPLADIVDAGIDDAFAFDLDQDRRLEVGAIELPEHEGEIGALGLPIGNEVGPELDGGRHVGTAYGDPPGAAHGRYLMTGLELRAKLL